MSVVVSTTSTVVGELIDVDDQVHSRHFDASSPSTSGGSGGSGWLPIRRYRTSSIRYAKRRKLYVP